MTVIIGQSYLLSSVLSVNLDLATVVVRYLIPGMTPDQFLTIPASIDLSSNTITALITSTINNTLGRWLFWLYITYPDQTVYKSKPIIIQCISEGSI